MFTSIRKSDVWSDSRDAVCKTRPGTKFCREVTLKTPYTGEEIQMRVVDPNLNFAELKKDEQVIFIGLTQAKVWESLILDQPNMSKYYDEMKLPSSDKTSLLKMLECIARYASSKLNFSKEKVNEIVISNNKTGLYGYIVEDSKNICDPIPCSVYIEEKQGVCRHFSMLTAYLLGSYARDNKLNATVNMYGFTGNEELQRSGHIVTIWQDARNSYLIDSTNHAIIDLNTFEGYSLLIYHYRKDQIDSMYDQYNINIPKKSVEPLVSDLGLTTITIPTTPSQSVVQINYEKKSVRFHFQSAKKPFLPPLYSPEVVTQSQSSIERAPSPPIPPPPIELQPKKKSIVFHFKTPPAQAKDNTPMVRPRIW